jgi:hypothetical protein
MNNQGPRALVFSLIPGLFCGLPTLLVLVTALVPTYFDRARRIVSTRPWQSFLLGLVNFVFFFAIAAVFGESAFPPLKGIAALSVLIVLPLMTVIGLAAASGVAGERVLALLTERPGTLLGTLVIGIVCLGLSALLPIIGWLVLAVLLMTGFGAALLALLRRNGTIPLESRTEASVVPESSEMPAE